MAALALWAVAAVLALGLLIAGPADAEETADEIFAEGLEAYDGGDYRASFGAWRPLAEAGRLEAQVALAGLYMSGLGVARDREEAVTWYRTAAEAGDPVAQLNLAEIYERGRDVARDPARAYAWYSLAADQGRRWAALRRDRLAEALTSDQRAEAESLISRYRPAD